jgi:hypothetical protein
MRALILSTMLLLFCVSCTTDFVKQEINTSHLSGYIEGGNAAGIYTDAGLKITSDSIQMKNWPMSRLVEKLNTLTADSLTEQTELTAVYTIQLANKKSLPTQVFLDSLVYQLKKSKLVD